MRADTSDDLGQLLGRVGLVAAEHVATSVFYLEHGTRLAGSSQRYRNRYVVVRSGSAFGSCAVEAGEVDSDICDLSGESAAVLMEHPVLAVRIAAADAVLGSVLPHREDVRAQVRTLPTGTPELRAQARDTAIADLLDIAPGATVALIGVVNPLVEAIRSRGGRVLACDRAMVRTQWGDEVVSDHRQVLKAAEVVVATGMTLGNGSFDEILAHCRSNSLPLIVYAQSGSAVAREFLGDGVTALSAETFPFSQFSADASPLYLYGLSGGSQ